MERQNINTEIGFTDLLTRKLFFTEGESIGVLLSKIEKKKAKEKISEITSTSINSRDVIKKIYGRASSWGYDKELDHIKLWVS